MLPINLSHVVRFLTHNLSYSCPSTGVLNSILFLMRVKVLCRQKATNTSVTYHMTTGVLVAFIHGGTTFEFIWSCVSGHVTKAGLKCALFFTLFLFIKPIWGTRLVPDQLNAPLPSATLQSPFIENTYQLWLNASTVNRDSSFSGHKATTMSRKMFKNVHRAERSWRERWYLDWTVVQQVKQHIFISKK